jgi:23S rRNA pseudouridine1911/1915/1917 synthase
MVLNTTKIQSQSDNTISLLYEDELVLGLYKPPGVTVNRAESVRGETVQDWMERRFKDELGAYASRDDDHARLFAERSGIAHRLDKETSGVLLAAKTPEALVKLMRQFKEREVQKTYVGLAHGRFDPGRGNISLPIGRSVQLRGRFQLDPLGKVATSFYEVAAEYGHSDSLKALSKNRYTSGFSLVQVHPLTGRTHQIRVHMSALGHPLVGDVLYGRKRLIEADLLWCKRHFLHAFKIHLTHPTGRSLDIKAPLAPDLLEALQHLALETGSDDFLYGA